MTTYDIDLVRSETRRAVSLLLSNPAEVATAVAIIKATGIVYDEASAATLADERHGNDAWVAWYAGVMVSILENVSFNPTIAKLFCEKLNSFCPEKKP